MAGPQAEFEDSGRVLEGEWIFSHGSELTEHNDN
jgi:hypothetical protein